MNDWGPNPNWGPHTCGMCVLLTQCCKYKVCSNNAPLMMEHCLVDAWPQRRQTDQPALAAVGLFGVGGQRGGGTEWGKN